MDIGAWLGELGLRQYEQAFRENDVDAEVLPELAEADLEKLGVVSLGHRKRLLKAIAALRADAIPGPIPPAAAKEPAEEHAGAGERSPVGAERRQLTVMFVDLVGSTALSTRLDPEDLRELIGAYHRRVAATVEREGGFVAKYMGDGVLAYFGWPRAHEDDPERAVRAGLALVEAVGRLQTPEPLRVRVGIATGLVVVGDLLGSGAAQEQAVVGETPNLAARLQALAEPDSLVIAASTRRLVGELFECADLGAVEVKGFAGPVRAYRVLGVGPVASRFEALRTAPTALVGREEELGLLLRRWRQAEGGEGRVVLLSGEPGVGKSRLLAAVQERLHDERHVRLRYFCSPHRQDSPLHPVIAQLERAAGFARGDPPPVRLGKLEALLAPTSPPAEDVALLAELLSLPPGDRHAPPPLAPQRKRERTFEALLRRLERLSDCGPALMVFEDVHWIDPSSRELLDLAVERATRLRVLLLVTFRPEFEPPWTGRPHVTVLALSRLGRREGAALVRQVAGGAALPEAVVTEIVERTDGVPLFVEELTKAVLEAGAAGTAAAIPPAALTVPATLHASLMARLDRLGPATRDIAQAGAAIGREFSYELLEAAARRPEAELHEALGRLLEAGLVLTRGIPPQASFAFKHALVQDAAYGTLLRGPRRQLHARIAAALEGRFPEIVAGRPEILAHHFVEAGEIARAATYWLEAGRRAARRSANIEAITHLRRGVEALDELPDTPERGRQELALQLALGPALMATRGWNAPEADGAYRRAEALARRLGEDRERFQAVWGLWMLQNSHSRSDLLAELFGIADRLGDAALRLQAHHASWASSTMTGDLTAASEHATQGLALYDPEKHRAHAFLYGGHDAAVCAKGMGALAQWLLGYPDRAARTAHEAVALAEGLAHPPSLAHAVLFATLCALFRRDVASALEHSERLLSLAAEHGLAQYGAMGSIGRGWALACRGQADAGLVEVHRGLDAFAGLGVQSMSGCFHAGLAESYGRAGRVELGLAAIEEALRVADRASEHFWRAGMLHVRGELLAYAEQPAEAEGCYLQALAVAREQRAKSLELRAALSLARLWRERGRRAEAHDLLASVYGWFTEGSDTPDLRAAEELLDELR